MRITQFTVHSSQFTVGYPQQRVVSREHAENGERKTKNSRSLFANPLSVWWGVMYGSVPGRFGASVGTRVGLVDQGSGGVVLLLRWVHEWCLRHRNWQLSRLVSPPLAQWMMWWTSHLDTGVLHPGCTHPPSRSSSARRSAGWDGAGAPADVYGLGVRVGDDAHDPGVACPAL
jgi:hypothetical protein